MENEKTPLSLLERVGRIVRERLEGADGCHDWDHTLRVCGNAERLLAAFPDADAEVVRLAALLSSSDSSRARRAMICRVSTVPDRRLTSSENW